MLSVRCLSFLSYPVCLPVTLVHCGQMVGWISPWHIVLDGDPTPLPPKGHSPPQFLAHFYCAQTAGGIKMPLGMEVGLGSGDIVRWVPSSPKKGPRPLSAKGAQQPPSFWPMSIVATVAHLSYKIVTKLWDQSSAGQNWAKVIFRVQRMLVVSHILFTRL